MLSLFTLLNVEAMKAMADDAETPMRRGNGDCPWSQPFTGSPCLGLLGFRECHYGSRSCGFGAGNTPVRTARVISVCQDFQWVNQYPSCPRGLNNSPWNNNPWNNNPWNNPPRRQWAQTCTTGDWNMMMCGDDSQCNVDTEGWACCAGRGGRAKCPGSHPYMCNTRICNGEWCCAPEAGICQGGVRRDGCGNPGMRMMEMMASPDTTGPKPKPGLGGGRRLETLEGLTDLSNELMTPEDALGAPESQAAVVVAGTPVTRRLGKKGELCRSALNPDGRCDYALKCVNQICRRDMSRRLDDGRAAMVDDGKSLPPPLNELEAGAEQRRRWTPFDGAPDMGAEGMPCDSGRLCGNGLWCKTTHHRKFTTAVCVREHHRGPLVGGRRLEENLETEARRAEGMPCDSGMPCGGNDLWCKRRTNQGPFTIGVCVQKLCLEDSDCPAEAECMWLSGRSFKVCRRSDQPFVGGRRLEENLETEARRRWTPFDGAPDMGAEGMPCSYGRNCGNGLWCKTTHHRSPHGSYTSAVCVREHQPFVGGRRLEENLETDHSLTEEVLDIDAESQD